VAFSRCLSYWQPPLVATFLLRALISLLAAFLQKEFYRREGSDLIPDYEDLTLLSEYTRDMGVGNGKEQHLYRAHFLYRGAEWFDWVWALGSDKKRYYPVRVYTFVRYKDPITGRMKAFAVVQGGDSTRDSIPSVDRTSAITKSFRIVCRKGKRVRGGELQNDSPRYRLVPCSALGETCLVVPNLKTNRDTLVTDPSQYEEFLLVTEYCEW
jgi:hypothetical protein